MKLFTVLGLPIKKLVTPQASTASARYTDEEYKRIKDALKVLAAAARYFAYCTDDDSFIYHIGRGPWFRDDDGKQFRLWLSEQLSKREVGLTIEYFKKFCHTSHIDSALKTKRLGKG